MILSAFDRPLNMLKDQQAYVDDVDRLGDNHLQIHFLDHDHSHDSYGAVIRHGSLATRDAC